MSEPAWLEGYEMTRPLGDGRYLGLIRLTFGRARVAVLTEGGPGEHW